MFVWFPTFQTFNFKEMKAEQPCNPHELVFSGRWQICAMGEVVGDYQRRKEGIRVWKEPSGCQEHDGSLIAMCYNKSWLSFLTMVKIDSIMIIITNFPFFSVHCLVVAQKTFALRQRCQGQQPWKLLSGKLLAESLRSSHCDFLTSKSVFFCR